MKLKLTASTSNPPVGSLIVRSLCSSAGLQVDVNWGQTTFLEGVNPESLSTDASISRYLARVKPELRLYGGDVLEQAQVDHWIGVAQGQVTAGKAVDEAFKELDSALERTTYLIGSCATIADYLVFAALNGSKEFKKCLSASTVGVNLSRWYDFISASPVVKEVLDSMPASSKSASQEPKQRGKKAGSPAVRNKGSSSAVSSSALPKEEGKFVALPGAEMGKVVVRFPPEASGYLHIGHAKAALLNQHYQLAFQGKLILRFDDTNPEKEKEDFERVILQDVELLNIKPDMFTFTSNFFDDMLVYCEKLIREGKAFVDDTEPELMKEEREQKVDSKNRSNSVEKNLALWEEMQNGTEKGLTCCVRAKIAMDSPNGCMRDPTIYRCKPQPHPKTGLKYKVYPTYDFACPIVDSLEGVTHALRTTEYHDRDDQYFWFIDALGLRKPYIYEYSRLNMTNTVLSKRRLRWIVDNGLVEGWDDPRFPTVRGILRRGLTVEGLKQFILAQGSSKSVVVMEWDKIWAFNKKVIDPVAPRYTCVDREANIKVHVKNSDGSPVKPEKKAVPVHPKNKDGPQKELWLGPVVLIDNNDAEVLVEGQNATFINWGNLRITKIHKNNGRIEKVDATTNLADEDYKKTPKITWLAESGESPVIPVECVFYDNIISKPILGKDEDFKAYINPHTRLSKSMLGERTLASLKRGDIIQIQRVGFFICDGEYMENNPMTCRTEPLLLNYIPDGKEDPEWVKILKAEATGQVRPVPTPASKSASATSVKSSPAAAKPAQRTAAAVDADIKAQGEKVRALKAEKADKAAVDVEVKSLLALKAEFKSLTGLEWKPGVEIPASQPSAPTGAGDASDLDSRIRSTGDEVRSLKSSKAPKDKIDAEVKLLLSLKEEFKKVSGIAWTPDYKPTSKESGPKSAADIDAAIVAQGDKVRSLKAAKAEKAAVEAEVKALLSLKAEYKSVTGSEWKPGAQPPTSKPDSTTRATPSGSKSAAEIDAAIVAQGDKVRSLKAAKAEKAAVEAEVKALLSLKAEYKLVTGSEWKPGAQPLTSKPESTPQATPSGSKSAADINAAIAAQGDKVRSLKAAKAEKSAVEAEVKALLNLKAEYKSVTGSDWKPGAQPPQQTASKSAADLNAEIASQGNKIRDLKSSKAPKATLDPEIQKLLALKAEYKTITGADWKPESQPAMSSQNGVNGAAGDNAGEALKAKITEQGAKVKKLKDSKAPADEVDKEVQELLKLKKDLLELTGEDLLGGGRSKSKASKPAKAAAKPAPKKEEPKEAKDGGLKHQTRLGLEAKKEENLPDWYTQVITKSEMIEYYDVSGCYIFRPWSYQIWEEIVKFFDGEIKKLGVQNCYFPMFVTKGALEREQTHVADFAPEVAWVTKSGQSDLAEPIAIRPTSETVMYPAYAKWIQSYRDLPIRLNQWNSVVRWEFKHPQPFLRTREFLWQEGHSAFAKKEEAEEEVYTILNLYRRIYEELLAIPVVRGKKTEKEKFAGGDFTTTTEAFISASGRGIQGATSHHLGQNFSKMFDIVYDDPETGEKRHVYQNSWGITTRTIGVVVMVHGDNTGLVLPPRIAPLQVVIVPCGVGVNTKPEDAKALMDKCEDYCKRLKDAGVRVRADLRDNYSPGWKFNHWELKGVPIRIELGPRDMGNKQFVAVRRDTGEKLTYGENILENSVTELLETIHVSMFNKAKGELDNHLVISESWDEFCNKLNEKCIILAPFCGDGECEEVIKKESARDEAAEPGAPAMGAKSLCIPFEQPKRSLDDKKCIHPRCTKKPQFYTLFGRSY